MFRPKNRKRTWGFQFSKTDALSLGIFTSASVLLWLLKNPLGWLLAMAIVHFFLFCNVFRIIRRRELAWAVLFILNAGVWLWFEELTWARVLLCQLPITAFLIAADMHTPGYHGVLAKRLNPRLDDYLEGRIP